MEERRMHQRYDSALEVKYSTPGSVGMEGYTISTNISRGGMRLPLSKFIRTGETIKLEIETNDRKAKVAAVGKVKWSKPISRPSPLQLDAGVEFIRIDSQDADRLLAALS